MFVSCYSEHITKSLDFSYILNFQNPNKYEQSRSFCLYKTLLKDSIGQPISLFVLLPWHIAENDLAELGTQYLIAIYQFFQYRFICIASFVHKINSKLTISEDFDVTDSVAERMSQQMSQADQFSLVIGHFAQFLADTHYCGVFEAKISANRTLAWVAFARTIKKAFIDSVRVYRETERLEGGNTRKMVLAKDLINQSLPLHSLALHYHCIVFIVFLFPHIQIFLQYLNPLSSGRLLELLQLALVKPLSLICILTPNQFKARATQAPLLSVSEGLIQLRLLEAIDTISQNSFL